MSASALRPLLFVPLLGCSPASVPVPRYTPLTESVSAIRVEASSERSPAPLSETARRIADEALASTGAYALLTELCDDIGARLSGSSALTRALTWAESRLKEAGHENVRIEPVMVPTWVRGRESLAVVAPEPRELAVLGLGGSVSTPKGGITGELVVVASETELAQRAAELRGKVVLIDRVMLPYDDVTHDSHYGDVFAARVHGASLAAAHGASAVLVRSLTANSLATLHTGALHYADGAPKVPAASVTVETASWLRRLYERNRQVTLRLQLESEDRGLTPSGNVVAELRGRERPDEIVVIGGHIDSWDVGQGAADDGAGVVISMEALTILRRLGLVPRRTVRVVLFTNEENGLRGAKEYAEQHASERHVAAVESDNGAARVVALGVDTEPDEHEPAAMVALEPVLALLRPLGVERFRKGASGADVAPLVKQGALGINLGHDDSRYFDVHHTHADTLDKVKPDELAQGVAAMAVLAYLLAELDLTLPPHTP